MRSEVTVSWGLVSRYTFDLEEVQPMPLEHARNWLDRQFSELGCEPLSPVGKCLPTDKLLLIAQAVGEQRFTDQNAQAWARVYARAVSAILAKPVVHIDVPSLTVSY